MNPDECLIIEDSIKGIESGLAAGMKTILFDPMNLFNNIIGVQKIDKMDKLKDIISAHNKT